MHFFQSKRLVCWVLGLCALGALPGCGGCSQDSKTPQAASKTGDQTKKKTKKTKKKKTKTKTKDPIEVARAKVQPHNLELPKNPKRSKNLVHQNWVKRGHWVSATQELIANRLPKNQKHFLGRLDTAVYQRESSLPITVDSTSFRYRSTQSVVLPKGQKRYPEIIFFVPENLLRTRLSSQLMDRNGNWERARTISLLRRMDAFEYYFFVLAEEPDRYKHIHKMPSSLLPKERFYTGRQIRYYRVISPQIETRVPLPSHPLTWTSIAYVLWDEVSPDKMTSDQKDAMLDWLHWGGQLLVSGPETLEKLKGSFLEAYLPATAGKPVQLTADTLKQLSDGWTINSEKKEAGKPLKPIKPWAGIELKKHPEASFVRETGQLLVERPVGRGRIVVSAFDLKQRDLIQWPSFDGFFNACLLRRPPRKYFVEEVNNNDFGYFYEDAGRTVLKWTGKANNVLDPRLVSKLRYFSRQQKGSLVPKKPPEQEYNYNPYDGEPQEIKAPDADVKSVAAWSDFNEVSDIARTSLQEAAGIVIPKPSFVVWCLTVYLVVLVPLNWACCRMLGHVEWAWFAAPVIALCGAVVVVWLAQIDIGFVRSRTEVAIVEIQGDYKRAHVTRYTALYTSLSTDYDLHFQEPNTLVMPFGFETKRLKAPKTVTCSYSGQGVSLRGFNVQSNSTDMLHSEQMVDMGGVVSLNQLDGLNQFDGGRYEVVNTTKFNLRGVGVLRRLGPNQGTGPATQAAWIGTLGPGESSPLEFQAMTEKTAFLAQRQTSPITGSVRPEGGIHLKQLVQLAQRQSFRSGEIRLVAWMDDGPIEGVRVDPPAPQNRAAALVIVHLGYGPFDQPKRDENTLEDINLATK